MFFSSISELLSISTDFTFLKTLDPPERLFDFQFHQHQFLYNLVYNPHIFQKFIKCSRYSFIFKNGFEI